MKNITDYLPKKSTDYHHVAGRVPTQVYKDVKKIIREDNLNWTELLTACLTHLIDQRKELKKNEKH